MRGTARWSDGGRRVGRTRAGRGHQRAPSEVLLLTRPPRELFAGLPLALVLLVLRCSRHQPAAVEAALVAGLAVLGVVSTAYLTHADGLVATREEGVLRLVAGHPAPTVVLLRRPDRRGPAARGRHRGGRRRAGTG